MQGQPAVSGIEEFNQLIDDLNKFVAGPPADEFSRARVLAEFAIRAQRLKEANKGFGFSALGSIACAKGDEEGMHRYHRRAIEFFPDAVTYSNYAGSLAVRGHYTAALDYALKAFETAPADVYTLRLLIKITDKLDMEDDFQRFVAMYRSVEGEDPEYVRFREENDDISLTAMCMTAAETSLSKIWDTPEEDAAWADL